ncbi:hypothetical protein ABZ896_09340 [Streptomyces sp. NPDC047072]
MYPFVVGEFTEYLKTERPDTTPTRRNPRRATGSVPAPFVLP